MVAGSNAGAGNVAGRGADGGAVAGRGDEGDAPGKGTGREGIGGKAAEFRIGVG